MCFDIYVAAVLEEGKNIENVFQADYDKLRRMTLEPRLELITIIINNLNKGFNTQYQLSLPVNYEL